MSLPLRALQYIYLEGKYPFYNDLTPQFYEGMCPCYLGWTFIRKGGVLAFWWKFKNREPASRLWVGQLKPRLNLEELGNSLFNYSLDIHVGTEEDHVILCNRNCFAGQSRSPF